MRFTNAVPTIFGIIAAVAVFIVMDPQWFPAELVEFAKFIAAGGIAGMGISSKGQDVGSSLPRPLANESHNQSSPLAAKYIQKRAAQGKDMTADAQTIVNKTLAEDNKS